MLYYLICMDQLYLLIINEIKYMLEFKYFTLEIQGYATCAYKVVGSTTSF